MRRSSILVLAIALAVLARFAAPPPAWAEATEEAAPAAAEPSPSDDGELAPPAADPGEDGPAPSPAATAPALAPGEMLHEVVQGDTLWDLAAKYLGSPWRWKDIWERNRFLTNPHFIYPGTKVLVIPPAPREYSLAGSEAPAPVIAPLPPPPAAKPPRGPRLLAVNPEDVIRAGVLLTARPKGIGAIRGGEEPTIDYSAQDTVFLSLKKEIPPGQLLGVYRVRPVRLSGGGSGYVKYLAGVLQVTGKKGGYHQARVRKSYEEIRKEMVVTEEIPSYRDMPVRSTPADLKATVVASRLENVELATGDVVYLDRGADAGVAPGDRFHLLDEKHDGGGAEASARTAVPRDVGTAVVVRATGPYATAVVVDSVRSFQAGVAAVGIPDVASH